MKGKKEANQPNREIRKEFILQKNTAAAKIIIIKINDDHPRIGLTSPYGKSAAIVTAITVAAVKLNSKKSVPPQIIGFVHLGNRIWRSI